MHYTICTYKQPTMYTCNVYIYIYIRVFLANNIIKLLTMHLINKTFIFKSNLKLYTFHHCVMYVYTYIARGSHDSRHGVH